MGALIEFLPFSNSEWLRFGSLFCLLSLFHMIVHFGFGFALQCLNSFQPWRKIQARQSKISAVTEIKESWSGFVGTPLCLSLGLWSQYKGWALVPLETTFWSVLGFFILATLIHDLWFYAVHRLLHTKVLIRWHRVHHMSPVPSVWTNDRFTLPDVLMSQSFLFVIPFVLPIPALALVLYRLSDHIKGLIGHSGYEYAAGPFAVWPMPFVCVLHHDAHHELFRYNFGNTLSIWDRLFGTLDPEYDKKVRQIRERLAEHRSANAPTV